jgi:tripartite-type tricarboxylate transporter receptor subunit TctC
VGGVYDLPVRDLAPYLSTYLHATVNPEDIASGGTTPGQDIVAASPPNGLIIGEANPIGNTLDVATNSVGVNFNLAREAFVGAFSQGAQVLVMNQSASITSFRQLVTTPGLSLVGTCQGQPDLFEHMLDAIWGATIKYICGFTNADAVTQGFVGSDAALEVNALPNVGPLLVGGVAKALAQSQPSEKGISFQHDLVGSLTPAKAAKEVPPKTKAEKAELVVAEEAIKAANVIIFMPSATPESEFQIVKDAVQWAYTQTAFKNQLLSQGIGDRLISGPSAKAVYEKVQNKIGVLTTILNSGP